jgi:hypothetical protein
LRNQRAIVANEVVKTILVIMLAILAVGGLLYAINELLPEPLFLPP